MADQKRKWASVVELAKTNGYSGAVPDLAADEAWDLSSSVDFVTNGYFGAEVTLEHDSSGTTDDIIVGVFPSIDGTDFDDEPEFQMTCSSDGSDDQKSFFVYDYAYFKIGVKTSGTTDTFDYRIKYRPWINESS